MNPFWLWVSAGCLACALCGFSAVRVGAHLWTGGGRGAATIHEPPLAPQPAVAAASAPVVRERPARSAAPRARAAAAPKRPTPTAPQPAPEKLALWARQVEAGERKMSLATDGCRVTWNRTCKHGHPTWLVHLGYLRTDT